MSEFDSKTEHVGLLTKNSCATVLRRPVGAIWPFDCPRSPIEYFSSKTGYIFSCASLCLRSWTMLSASSLSSNPSFVKRSRGTVMTPSRSTPQKHATERYAHTAAREVLSERTTSGSGRTAH